MPLLKIVALLLVLVFGYLRHRIDARHRERMTMAGGSGWAYYSRRSKEGCPDGRFMMRSTWLGLAVIAASGAYVASLFLATAAPGAAALGATGNQLIAPLAAPRLTAISAMQERQAAATQTSTTVDVCRDGTPAGCTAASQTASASATARPAT